MVTRFLFMKVSQKQRGCHKPTFQVLLNSGCSFFLDNFGTFCQIKKGAAPHHQQPHFAGCLLNSKETLELSPIHTLRAHISFCGRNLNVDLRLTDRQTVKMRLKEPRKSMYKQAWYRKYTPNLTNLCVCVCG